MCGVFLMSQMKKQRLNNSILLAFQNPQENVFESLALKSFYEEILEKKEKLM